MDLVEQIAVNLHEGWMQYKKSKGVTYGPERTASTHPHMLKWDELPDVESKNQDRFIAALILDAYSQCRIDRCLLT
ncbi:MAG: RyR domain-containing protein, partial [Planctomycetaceae bacterium]